MRATVVGGTIVLTAVTLYAVYQLSQALERSRVVPRDPVIEAKCKEYLYDCLDDSDQPPWNQDDFGKKKPCGDCYQICINDGGNWPVEKCPL